MGKPPTLLSLLVDPVGSLFNKIAVSRLESFQPSQPNFLLRLVLDLVEKPNQFEEISSGLGFRFTGQKLLAESLGVNQASLVRNVRKGRLNC